MPLIKDKVHLKGPTKTAPWHQSQAPANGGTSWFRKECAPSGYLGCRKNGPSTNGPEWTQLPQPLADLAAKFQSDFHSGFIEICIDLLFVHVEFCPLDPTGHASMPSRQTSPVPGVGFAFATPGGGAAPAEVCLGPAAKQECHIHH